MKNSQIILSGIIGLLVIAIFFMFGFIFSGGDEELKQQTSENTISQNINPTPEKEVQVKEEITVKPNKTLEFEVDIQNNGGAEITFKTTTNLLDTTEMDLYLFSDAKMDTFVDIIEDIDYSRWYNATLLNMEARDVELQKVMNNQSDWDFNTEVSPNQEYSFLLYHPQARTLTDEETKNGKRLMWIDYLKMHNKAKEFFASEQKLRFMFEIPQFTFDENYKKSDNPGYFEIKDLPESCERYTDKYGSKSIRCEFMMN